MSEGLQRRTVILGVPVDHVSRQNVPALVDALIDRPGMAVMAPVNIDILNQADENERLKAFLQRADLVYSDGAGPVLGSRMLGDPLPPRITSIALLHLLCRHWQDGRRSLYFLGGPPGVGEQAAEVLRRQYPGVQIVGTWRGHLTPAEEQQALADIARCRPDVLCVGFGTPLQEFFIEDFQNRLRAVPLVWPVGALTSHIAGRIPRAPRWMRQVGLEWLHRLRLEPRRMWRRYLLGNPRFVMRVLVSHWKAR